MTAAANPLSERSELPFELPDFASIHHRHYLPAIEAAMAAQLEALARIAADPAPPTAINVIDAWETSGARLSRGVLAFYNLKWADSDDELASISDQIAPALARHADAIWLNPALYRRLLALVSAAEAGETVLDAEQSWWLERSRLAFERSGIHLPEDAQHRLRELNARIAELQSAFSRLSREGSNAAGVLVEDSSLLEGFSPSQVVAAAERATESGHAGGWLIDLDNTSGQRSLTQLSDRDLRERIHRAAIGRGLGGEHDTRAVIVELARLRAERAGLLGFSSHADYVAADGCAGSARAVLELLSGLVPAVARNLAVEAEDLSAVHAELYPGSQLAAWDWQYDAEVLRSRRFSLDTARLRPYLELDSVLHRGVFAAATGLYGITFTPRPDLVGYHDDVRIWQVDEADGTPVGLFLGDFHTRGSKAGGAWMNNLVDQNHLARQLPVVCNNSNLVRPAAGEPTLMTWDDVITLFHEFGHTLHGLLANSRYPSHSGTNTPRDFVEYPSQVNEMWAVDPQLLRSYAVHHQSGEPMPEAWVGQLLASATFQQGYATAEYLAAALLDQAWHSTSLAELPTTPDEVEAFEDAALEAAGLNLPLVPPRYRSGYFRHTFEGGYDAGYYSYLWSEVMDADTAALIRSNGGLTRRNGERFRRMLLAPGGSVDVMASFRAYRGRDPELRYLLQRRQLL